VFVAQSQPIPSIAVYPQQDFICNLRGRAIPRHHLMPAHDGDVGQLAGVCLE